jgi:ketosteroid isomerase-like protein
VRDSWSRIFNNTASIQFEVSDIEITLGGAAAAWVVCIETLTVPSDDGPQSARMLATNIFRRGADGWRIVHHHAAPVLFDRRDAATEPEP